MRYLSFSRFPLTLPSLFFLTVVSLCLPILSIAQSLKITSNPPGASIELDGVPVSTTPFEKSFPGGYFHRTHTALGQRLEHPMIARVSLASFITHEIVLTEGPMEWIDLHGRHHREYWLFKSNHFNVDLETITSTFTGVVAAATPAQPAALELELSPEELVRLTKPAVVWLKTLTGSGSGFFVTETGVIATNAHMARGDSSLLALLPNGLQLQASVVYIDPDLDLALVKVAPPSPEFLFPHLALADTSQVRQGKSVLVIGNPSDAMLFSVTKGIVSAVGRFPAAGPGTWIQTDAQINPGNSGGPLVNTRTCPKHHGCSFLPSSSQFGRTRRAFSSRCVGIPNSFPRWVWCYHLTSDPDARVAQSTIIRSQ
ncbi:MAG: trypsin-like peptidase domain-containing protein [Candidatus Acidiferrum sp.]